jgi:beta-glucanase (GH16 family)
VRTFLAVVLVLAAIAGCAVHPRLREDASAAWAGLLVRVERSLQHWRAQWACAPAARTDLCRARDAFPAWPVIPPAPPPARPAEDVLLRGEARMVRDGEGALWSIAPARNGSLVRDGVDLAETMNVARLEFRNGVAEQTNDRGGVWRWRGPVDAPAARRWQSIVAEPRVRPPAPPDRPSPLPVEGVMLERRGLTLAYEENFDALSFDIADTRAPLNGRMQTWLNNDHDPRRNRDNFYSRTLHQETASEDQYYLDPYIIAKLAPDLDAARFNPFSVENGVLRITARRMPPALVDRFEQGLGRAWRRPSFEARKAWASGLISTHESFAQRYGVWEARMRLPDEPGMFPAFWMLNAKGGWPPEIDIVDNYHTGRFPDRIVSGGVTHRDPQRGFGPSDGGQSGKRFPVRISGVWHTFSMEWTPQHITYFLDGAAYWREPTPSNFHDPMFLIINLAVLGPGAHWADKPAPDLENADMEVDWVRVWRR